MNHFLPGSSTTIALLFSIIHFQGTTACAQRKLADTTRIDLSQHVIQIAGNGRLITRLKGSGKSDTGKSSDGTAGSCLRIIRESTDAASAASCTHHVMQGLRDSGARHVVFSAAATFFYHRVPPALTVHKRLASIFLADAFGRPAWNPMVRRTQTMFYRPEERRPEKAKKPRMNGEVTKWASRRGVTQPLLSQPGIIPQFLDSLIACQQSYEAPQHFWEKGFPEVKP